MSVLDNGSIRNAILGNVLFNAGPGIDLGGNGVTANRPGGFKVAPNLGQNSPVLTFAAGGKLGITLNGAPSTSYAVDYYASRPADSSAGPQAERVLGRVVMTTDAAGNAGPVVVNYATDPAYTVFSATATDPFGDTSELSGTADPAPLKVVPVSASLSATVAGSAVIAGFADLDPTATLGRLAALVNWGDGSPTTVATLVAAGTGFSVVGSHTYKNAGSYAAVVTVIDGGLGVTSVVTSQITVAPPPITVVGRTIALRGNSVQFSGVVASFTDAGPARTAKSYVATIAWGDGKVAVGKITVKNGVFSVQASRHITRFAGVHRSTVTVSDNSGRRAVAFGELAFAAGRK